jgi:1-deoxy-D-xylulose-5-phosphate reductoisomerase
MPIVLNAANEVAVAAFLDRRLPFTAIPALIADAMDAYDRARPPHISTLAEVRTVDAWAREFAERAAGVQSNF